MSSKEPTNPNADAFATECMSRLERTVLWMTLRRPLVEDILGTTTFVFALGLKSLEDTRCDIVEMTCLILNSCYDTLGVTICKTLLICHVFKNIHSLKRVLGMTLLAWLCLNWKHFCGDPFGATLLGWHSWHANLETDTLGVPGTS